MTMRFWVHGSITIGPHVVEVWNSLAGSIPYWHARIEFDGITIQTTQAQTSQAAAEAVLSTHLSNFIDTLKIA